MQFSGRSIVRLVAFLAAGVIIVGPSSSKSISRAVTSGADLLAQPQAMYRPEVRLRKLHLVRPDLIPYPIAYEVYC